MRKKVRTFVFIDSQNLHLGIKGLGWNINYRKLFVYLKEKYKADEVNFYVGFIKENQKLYSLLKEIGYILCFKRVTRMKGNKFKGNIDVDLTVDAIRKVKRYDKSIFISADGDFEALYDFLTNEKNKELIIMIPNEKKYSKKLLKYRGNLRFMNDLKRKVGE